MVNIGDRVRVVECPALQELVGLTGVVADGLEPEGWRLVEFDGGQGAYSHDSFPLYAEELEVI